MATLVDVNLAVPRGKYTIDFEPTILRFHGKTFNYKVKYTDIAKGFILPMNNELQVAIVLHLDANHPIKQGQTVHRNIVLQIKKDVLVDLKSKVSPQIVKKYPNLKEME